jgi:hypothetical protein
MSELLAKLTASGVNITGEGFGGGSGGITESDVAAALAGLKPPVYHLMRLKYCADESVRSHLIDHIAAKMADDEHFRAPGPCNFDLLAGLAVFQVVDGGLCWTCNGTGTYQGKEHAACKGTGKRHISRTKAAEMAGLSRDHYVKYWENVSKRYMSLLHEFDSAGASHLRRQFSAG